MLYSDSSLKMQCFLPLTCINDNCFDWNEIIDEVLDIGSLYEMSNLRQVDIFMSDGIN